MPAPPPTACRQQTKSDLERRGSAARERAPTERRSLLVGAPYAMAPAPQRIARPRSNPLRRLTARGARMPGARASRGPAPGSRPSLGRMRGQYSSGRVRDIWYWRYGTVWVMWYGMSGAGAGAAGPREGPAASHTERARSGSISRRVTGRRASKCRQRCPKRERRLSSRSHGLGVCGGGERGAGGLHGKDVGGRLGVRGHELGVGHVASLP